jgi:hypothetical protein
LNKLINPIFTISTLSTLNKMSGLLTREPARRIRQSKRPQEVIRLLEVRPHGENLVDQVFHADDARRAQGRLDDGVVVDRETLFVDFGESALVDELADGF